MRYGDNLEREKTLMPCSIMNDRVQLTFSGRSSSINLMMGETDHMMLGRSALQRPDVRRAELAAMLRKYMKTQKSAKSQSTYWRTFMTGYTGNSANSNDLPLPVGADS
ncbi:MAG: hypothetical protein VXY16_11475 [Pseudomonadota bacterium]|nr:hypothetical protein [Pseudomonadota bacterium]